MIPKYEQIKQDLLSELKNHQFTLGDKFYSEADIKQKYSVSSITAVKALNELTTAGYLYRVQGKGTYVSKSKVSQNVKFSDIELHSHDHETVKVLSIKQDNQPEILKALGLKPNDSYYQIKRVRFFDDIPFLIHFTHLPNHLVKTPLSKNLSDYASVYKKILDDFGIDLFLMPSVETNEIIFPDDAELSHLLNLSFREPAVKQVKHTFLPNRTVAEYIVSYKHWKYFKTKIEVDAQ
ncbi:GntR family transcriptional regulator [Pseudolactococcus yaeyamensis]